MVLNIIMTKYYYNLEKHINSASLFFFFFKVQKVINGFKLFYACINYKDGIIIV